MPWIPAVLLRIYGSLVYFCGSVGPYCAYVDLWIHAVLICIYGSLHYCTHHHPRFSLACHLVSPSVPTSMIIIIIPLLPRSTRHPPKAHAHMCFNCSNALLQPITIFEDARDPPPLPPPPPHAPPRTQDFRKHAQPRFAADNLVHVRMGRGGAE